MRAIVIKNTGSWYTVQTDQGSILQCKIKGNFRLKGIRTTNPIAVGDHVEVVENNEGTAFIHTIHPRQNYIIRRASNLSKQSHILAANIDLAILLVTVNYPITTTIFIDRFLATAEAYRIPVQIVFNKIDRLTTNEDVENLEDLMTLYQTIGYPCTKISAKTGEGVDALRSKLSNKTILLSGHSGVGKSTLINSLVPEANLRTAAISEYHNTGTHTTTFSEMIPLNNGGWLIDTPGIKGFGTIEMCGAEVAHYFPDIFKYVGFCKYGNCTHTHEPTCAVIEAVENQELSLSRYKSYLSILTDKDEKKYREDY